MRGSRGCLAPQTRLSLFAFSGLLWGRTYPLQFAEMVACCCSTCNVLPLLRRIVACPLVQVYLSMVPRSLSPAGRPVRVLWPPHRSCSATFQRETGCDLGAFLDECAMIILRASPSLVQRHSESGRPPASRAQPLRASKIYGVFGLHTEASSAAIPRNIAATCIHASLPAEARRTATRESNGSLCSLRRRPEESSGCSGPFAGTQSREHRQALCSHRACPCFQLQPVAQERSHVIQAQYPGVGRHKDHF